MLEIAVLGRPRFALDGAPLRFRAPARALALLAYLAVNPGDVPRKRLAFLFWPDIDEESALANLRRHLSLIEEALPHVDADPWIRKDRVSVEWSGDGRAFVDAAVFEELSGDASRNAEAVALYEGNFLEGVSDDEWVVMHRERLHAIQLSLLASLVARYRASADPASALRYAEEAHRLDPWREDLFRDVLMLRRDHGDVAGAHEALRAFRARLWEELGVEPDAETLGVLTERPERLDRDAFPAAGPEPHTVPNNLPCEPGDLFGRAEIVAATADALAAAAVATLCGPGGVGKTRVARRAAATLLPRFPDGAWFVDLAPLRNGEGVTHAVASALGLIEVKERPLVETLQRYLSRRSVLLVLDNCEHVVEAAAELCATLVAASPNLRVVATSREPLNIAPEHVVLVPPLPVPAESQGDASTIAASAAVELLVQRVQSIDARFRLTEDNSRLVADICRQLDGLPLAIELAAPRIKALGLSAARDLLTRRFAALTGGRREALPRQQTLRALYDWSHDRLTERERIVFRRLAIFSGGWSLDGACAVCADEVVGSGDVIDLLSSLVGKSLVQCDEGSSEQRYRFLESTRQYAVQWLDAAAEHDALARRHADYMTRLAGRFEAAWLTETDDTCIALLQPELDNVRAALTWALTERNDVVLGAMLAVRCERMWTMALYLEGRRWLSRSLEALDADQHSALAARVLGALFAVLPDGHERLAVGTRAIAALRSAQDDVALGRVLAPYGHLVAALGRDDEGAAAVEEALVLARRTSDTRTAANAMALRAVQLQRAGDVNAAHELCTEALLLHDYAGSVSGRAYTLYTLAELDFARGDVDGALVRALEADALLRRMKSEARVLGVNASNMAGYAIAKNDFAGASEHARAALASLHDMEDLAVFPLEHAAVVQALSGDPWRAARLFGFTDAALHRMGMVRGPTEAIGVGRGRAALEERLGADELRRCMERGADLPFKAAVSLAVAD